MLLTFSNFESMFNGPKVFLPRNTPTTPFTNIDCSFADVAFDFFVKRYITNLEVNNNFTDELWKPYPTNAEKKDAEEVGHILKNKNASGTDKTKAVYRISYRFRDNLLHGNPGKETHRLKDYEHCFCKINDFMFQLMNQLV